MWGTPPNSTPCHHGVSLTRQRKKTISFTTIKHTLYLYYLWYKGRGHGIGEVFSSISSMHETETSGGPTRGGGRGSRGSQLNKEANQPMHTSPTKANQKQPNQQTYLYFIKTLKPTRSHSCLHVSLYLHTCCPLSPVVA